MYTVKSFSILAISVLLATSINAQNTKPQATINETDLKPAVVNKLVNTIPAPGTRVVAANEQANAAIVAPIANNGGEAANKPEKLEAIAIPSASDMQSKMTNEMKATMAGKSVRPKTIDRTSGATESKLTPATPIGLTPSKIVEPIAPLPIKEN